MTRLDGYLVTGILRVRRCIRLDVRDDGQTLAEYALILALIAVIAVVALVFLGGTITKLFSSTGNKI